MPDFVGKRDHTPFGSFSAELVWGERANGTHVHVSHVERGLACDCICPACGVRLIGNKGDIKTHYFSHHGKDSGCSSAAETNAHLWAKDILARELKLTIPAVGAIIKGRKKIRSKARVFHFVSAKLERRTGNIVPDVILTAKNGRELIVEIYVTHRCDNDKKAKLRTIGISAIEIDLSSCRYVQDEEVVKERLLGASLLIPANRSWLYNPVIDELKEEIAVELRREAEVAAAIADRRAILLLKAAEELPLEPDSPEIDVTVRVADEFGRGGTVGLASAEGRGFSVPTRFWQAALLLRIVMRASPNAWSEPPVTIERAMTSIRDCLLPAFIAPIPAGVRAAVKKRDVKFVFPEEAIGMYLNELLFRGILETNHQSEELTVSRSERRHIENRRREIDAIVARLKDVKERVTDIIKRLPEDEQMGFDFDAWCELPFGDQALPLETLASVAGEDWSDFEEKLSSVESLFWPYRHGRPAPRDFLGLPLDAELRRIAERALKKAEEEQLARVAASEEAARKRVQSLTDEAYRILSFVNAPGWLASMPEGSAVSYEALSASGEQGHTEAYGALHELHERRLAEQRREEIATRCRQQLSRAANERYDSVRVSLFLNNYDRDLGCSPTEYCTDDMGLQRCLAVLAKQTRQPVKRSAKRL